MEASRPLRVVFVGNIPYDTTEESLLEIFRTVGPVLSFRLVFDRDTGKPKGYGFCEYSDAESARSSIRNLNDYDLNGRLLRVDYADSALGAPKEGRMEGKKQRLTEKEERDRKHGREADDHAYAYGGGGGGGGAGGPPGGYYAGPSAADYDYFASQPPPPHYAHPSGPPGGPHGMMPPPPGSYPPPPMPGYGGPPPHPHPSMMYRPPPMQPGSMPPPHMMMMMPPPPMHGGQPLAHPGPAPAPPLPGQLGGHTASTDRISSALSSLPPSQLSSILSQSSRLVHSHPEQARALLSSNPQLTYALFYALWKLDLIESSQIARIVQSQTEPSRDKERERERDTAPPPPPPPVSAGVPATGATAGSFSSASASAPVQTTSGSQPSPPVTGPPQASPMVSDPRLQDSHRALLNQIMAMTDAQIEALPTEQREKVKLLKTQFLSKSQ